MKTKTVFPAQMDEIVFEHRNKSYGAYILRKMYNRELAKALFIATAILLAGLAYPLALSYRSLAGAKFISDSGPIEFMNVQPPVADPPVVPPPPPPVSQIQRQVVFVPPVVVAGDEPTVDINMDIINKTTTNIPLVITVLPDEIKPKDNVLDIKTDEPPLIFAPEMPLYPGGDAERQIFLNENIRYPQLAIENDIQGTVYVKFVVDTKGNITDVTVLRGIGGGCDEEAVRVIKMMPQWHAGRQNGRPVRVFFTMPVVFRLQQR